MTEALRVGAGGHGGGGQADQRETRAVGRCARQRVLAALGGRATAGVVLCAGGAVALGTSWDEPVMANFAALNVTEKQALLVMVGPGVPKRY